MSIKTSITLLSSMLAAAAGFALISIAGENVLASVITGAVWLVGTIIAFKKAVKIGEIEGSKPVADLKSRDSILVPIGVMFAAAVIIFSIMWASAHAPALALVLFYSTILAILVGIVSAFILARAEMTTRYKQAIQL